MSAPRSSPTPAPASSYKDVPTGSVSVHSVDFVYRQLGPDRDGAPLILLHHLAAVLDNWDPRAIDGLAARRRVITVDNRGVGASGGSTPDTIEAVGPAMRAGLVHAAWTSISSLSLPGRSPTRTTARRRRPSSARCPPPATATAAAQRPCSATPTCRPS
ncbi:hypothetical protein [Streptomyces sp. NPDC049915]|uniref:alpha/beta fold hydrolase n=1 Tax=Streptomyces sp. NPDC049915 TaxID=3155510 RepID=UPI00342DC56F